MKKKTITGIIMVFCVFLSASCSQGRQSAIEKANTLLSQKALPEVQSLDSLTGYEDVYNTSFNADKLLNTVDSILAHQKKEKRLLTEEEKRRCLDFVNDAYQLRLKAARNELKHRLAHDPEVFVGYKVVIKNSDMGSNITIYFDKDIKRLAIESK